MSSIFMSRRSFLALSGTLGAASLVTAACAAVPAAAPADGAAEDTAVTLSHWAASFRRTRGGG